MPTSAFVPVVFPALAALPTAAQAQSERTLNWVLIPEPPTLVTAFNSAQMVQQISAKMMDGLLSYNKDFEPVAALATSWQVAPDGLSIAFRLRDGVKWHDGAPFSSANVKYTFEEILKKYHPRGRATFTHLQSVDTPDELTAVFRLAKPSAYIMAALSASESPVLPKHLYERGEPRPAPCWLRPWGLARSSSPSGRVAGSSVWCATPTTGARASRGSRQ